MGKKRDTKQIDSIARRCHMTKSQRRRFREFIEQEKRDGNRGTLNEKGGFTYSELKQKAQEFLEDY
jgi:hypothetical protein